MRAKPLAAVLLLAVLVRGGALLLTPGALTADTDDYLRLAENLVEHGTLGHGASPTAFRPPLYPLMLTGCVAAGEFCRTAIGAVHLILGAATVGLVYVLGGWWGLSRRGAALAALLAACDPILLFQSTLIMTETAAAFFAVLGLAVLTWVGKQLMNNVIFENNSRGLTAPRESTRNASTFRELLAPGYSETATPDIGYRAVLPALLAGAVLALGALCRPTLLPWLLAAGVALLLLILKNSRGPAAPGIIAKQLRLPAAFAIGAAIVLSPWMIRNQVQFGRPIATTTHGGYTLLLANNPEFYQWLRSGRWGDAWRADRFNAEWNRRRPDNEIAADRLAYTEARQTIRNEPCTFAYSCLVRWGRFWSPLPHRLDAGESPARRLARYTVAVWYVLVFILAAAGAWRIYSNFINNSRGLTAPGESIHNAGTFRGMLAPGYFNIYNPTFVIRPGWLWGLLLTACLTAVHTFYWTDMRMRAVAMPVVALAAAAGAFRPGIISPPAPAGHGRGPLV